MVAGRPRAFDMEQALDRALQVFWRKGYEGTSLPDLTDAMGINRPSLYAAFGNKESLFRKALDRYSERNAIFVDEALSAPTAREVVEKLLHSVAYARCCPENPPGCLAVQAALVCGDDAESIRKELVMRRAASESRIRERMERAKEEGDLPTNADPTVLARYVSTVIQGMAVQSASGASHTELETVVEMALLAWPT
ncbi:MAG: TetR/AcrR family transcriptional regulator [Methylophilaceae bacterium]|uniref:TetR/AcrR family transcriptional regulator n=1 Tax=Methylovorus sp. MM2 TaxID=1848038 RepID=UPI0007DFF86C|nr:TetR/AcrR family transcriptional regulator [Methylovorus sp. MM2]OAM52537.1 TetR family transcriptional regulator [Methylovorus sp. MM2]